MLERQRLSPDQDEKREELFTQRYERLLGWALRLTNQQRETAEDLVQDAFVQFMLGRTSLEEIENIDGYLRRMLRYMHLSRISRNAQQLEDVTLTVADYDSLHLSWQATEPSRRMQAQEELHRVGVYACGRKETSRAGSVLILRFFHDYLPSEIAAVLCSSRHCVDQWQALARREVKLLLTDPDRLRFAVAKPPTASVQSKLSLSDCDLMAELRELIFSSRQGECLTGEQLRDVYKSGDDDLLTTTRLAHIVSCRLCLDEVNRLLALPLLSERYLGDPCNEKQPPRDGDGGGASGGTSDLGSRYQRRLREVGEHKPQELRIGVNGSRVGTLKVSSELSELDLNLAPGDELLFVDIASEQGIQLLFFTVDEQVSPDQEQWARINLSEGRKLEACLHFDNGPRLKVTYSEPSLEELTSPASLRLVKANSLSSPLSNTDNAVAVEQKRSRLQRLASWIRALGSSKRDFTKTRNEAESSPSTDVVVLGLASQLTRKPFWRRPEWLTALISILLVGAFLILKYRMPGELTAVRLIDHARVAEEMSDLLPDQVTHRLINLEERRSAEGALISRRRIEIWQNAARGERARRLYDESNHLLAGTWLKGDGSHTVYHSGSGAHAHPAPAKADNLLLNLDDIWQLEPSAKEFGSLAAGSEVQVEERPSGYVIIFVSARAIGSSRLLKATLTLNKNDLHAIEQTLLIERSGEVREYRFVEASFERLPQTRVSPAVFALEPELMGKAGASGRPREGANLIVAPSPGSPSTESTATHTASAELEVDVAYLLNQAKGDRSEQVSLTRTANGMLRVEGIVDDEARKRELLNALAPVSNNPAVKIEIGTIAETLLQQRRPSGAITFRDAEDTVDDIAVDRELRDYLSRKDAALRADGLDEAVRNLSSKVVNRGYRALFHAIELKRLMNRFANVDMRTVTPDARAKWLQMVHEHAVALERDTASLRQEIGPIFFSGESIGAGDEPELTNDADLARAAERLHRLALANNDAIRAAFTISSQSSAAVKSQQFWRSLAGAEKLAARVKQYGGF